MLSLTSQRGIGDEPSTVGVVAEMPVSEQAQHFVFRVLPVLRSKCLVCHGDDPDDLRGEYDMRTRAALLRGGESGQPAVLPGNAAESPLYQAVCWDGLEMPPKENDRLDEQQCDNIATWIAGGAIWLEPEQIQQIEAEYADQWSVGNGIRVATSGGLSADWTNRTYDPATLWAYQPLSTYQSSSSNLPREDNPRRADSSGTIDHFIERRLRDLGLPPAPLADRATLIRRATYDLIGLAPSAAEVQSFVADPRDDHQAFSAVVDRLLASPHYGEKWGRHWLDVVRYADSSGYANDYHRGNAWRYRDYVVRSFNADKPFDQFIREQIAGDEIDPSDPEMLIAVGFLRMGPWELTGMEVPKIARQRFLDDVTNSVGETFLAHSLQCARCHDHKFDPIPTRDYYAIQACFATTQLVERRADFLPAENLAGFEEQAYLQQLQREHQQTLVELDQLQLRAADEWYQQQQLDPTAWQQAVAEVADAASGNQFRRARGRLQKQQVPEAQIPLKGVGFQPQEFGRERVARKGLEQLRWELDRYQPFALSVYDGGTRQVSSVSAPLRLPKSPLETGNIESSHILLGGDPFSSGPEVQPAALSLLANQLSAAIPATPVGRRTALAEWIASPQNPLTPKVIANRIWQWHFGRAIAGNPNNFGATGKQPSHPELLDWLASELIASGWSMKHLHRLIMSSEAYRRQAIAAAGQFADMEIARTNYALFTPRRLSAEELRDSQLQASGELNRTIGGIPSRPEINMEVAMQPRMVMGTFARAWVPNALPQQRHRRSIYALTLRGLRDPAMEVFDQPGPDFSCEARSVATVTPQVFAMFNSQHSYARAVAIAKRVIDSSTRQQPAEAIQQLYQYLFARKADDRELSSCLKHWETMQARHASINFERPQVPTTIRREAVEENTGERFVFTESLPEYADFVPDLGLADLDVRARGLAEVALVLLNSNEFSYIY
ncbi:PSD1 and planctomycete cytochrome C domain-containing protein [Planctomycetaceae bacterium SH139]